MNAVSINDGGYTTYHAADYILDGDLRKASQFPHQRIPHLLLDSWLGISASDAASKVIPHMLHGVAIYGLVNSHIYQPLPQLCSKKNAKIRISDHN